MHEPLGMPGNLDLAAYPNILAEPPQRIRSFIDRLRPSLISQQSILGKCVQNLPAPLTVGIANEGGGLIKRLSLWTTA
jgi:hypothetical protein